MSSSTTRLVTLVVAVAAVLSVARTASAQVFSQMLPETYQFKAVVNDLRFAGVEVSPTPLVEAYRTMIERWAAEQADARAALRNVVGTEPIFYGATQIDRAMKVIHRARGAAEQAEEAFFVEISRDVPDLAQAAIARVRDWRRTQRAVPRGLNVNGILSISEIGDVVRRSTFSDDDAIKVREALAAAESDRRKVLTQLQANVEDARRSAAKLVDDLGVTGRPDGMKRSRAREDSEWQQKVGMASMLDSAPVADAIETQLKAYRVLAPVLPRTQRRAVFDGFAPALAGDPSLGAGIGLPGRARSPSEVARRVLAWKELSVTSRAATREVVKKWLDEDDAAVLAGLDASVVKLRESHYPDFTETARATAEKRKTIAARHLADLSKASGADWLVDPSIPTPELDELAMSGDDREAIGVEKPRPPAATSTSATASRIDFVPFSFDEKAQRALVDALAPSVTDRASYEQAVREQAEHWERSMRAAIETAQTLSRLDQEARIASMSRDPNGDIKLDAEIVSSADAVRAARRELFEQGDAADATFATGLSQRLGGSAAPTIRAFIVGRRMNEWLSQSNAALGTIDLARNGGAPLDIVSFVIDGSRPAAVRGAAAAALADQWTALTTASKELRSTFIDANYGDAIAYARQAKPDAAPDAASPNRAARVTAVIQAIERWFALEDALLAAMISSAESAGQSDAMRLAIDRAKFNRAYGELAALERARDAILLGQDFASRAELVKELDKIATTLEVLAKRQADLFRVRVQLSALPPDQRELFGQDRGPDLQTLSYVRQSLYGATTWLIDQVTPKEIVEASPELMTTVRYSYWR